MAYLNLIVYFVVVVSRNHQMVVRQNPTAERKYFASIVNRFGGCRTSSNRFLIVIVEFSLATKPSLRNPPYNVQPNEKSYPEKKTARLLHNNLAASCLRELLNIPEPSAVYNFLILTFDYTSHHHRYYREWVSDSFRAMRNEVDFVYPEGELIVAGVHFARSLRALSLTPSLSLADFRIPQFASRTYGRNTPAAYIYTDLNFYVERSLLICADANNGGIKSYEKCTAKWGGGGSKRKVCEFQSQITFENVRQI